MVNISSLSLSFVIRGSSAKSTNSSTDKSWLVSILSFTLFIISFSSFSFNETIEKVKTDSLFILYFLVFDFSAVERTHR